MDLSRAAAEAVLSATAGGAAAELPASPAMHLHSKITEIGTLEVWCISRDGKQRWKLEFNVREKVE